MIGEPELWGLPMIESWVVPRDVVILANDPAVPDSDHTVVCVHPSTALAIKNGGRFPLWTRHSRGMIELDRDRRRYGR